LTKYEIFAIMAMVIARSLTTLLRIRAAVENSVMAGSGFFSKIVEQR
jgi:hypothetical protein